MKNTEARNKQDPKKLPPVEDVINNDKVTFTVEQIYYQIRHNRGALSRFFIEIAEAHEKKQNERVCKLLQELGDFSDEKAAFLSKIEDDPDGVTLSMEKATKRIEELEGLGQSTDELRRRVMKAFISVAKRVLHKDLLIKFRDGSTTRIAGIMKNPDIKNDGTIFLELNDAELDESGTGYRVNKSHDGTYPSKSFCLTETPITILKDYSIE